MAGTISCPESSGLNLPLACLESCFFLPDSVSFLGGQHWDSTYMVT